MSASSGPLASTKGESTSSKATKPAYDHLDINKLYKGKSSEPVSKPVTQKHGMQALGKAIPARRPGQTSVKADNTPNDVSNSSASNSQTSSAALAPTNQGQQSQGNQPPPGWANTLPHPPGPPSPHNVPNVPLTGQQQQQQHVHDKNWSGSQDIGPYPSQRFAQEFPSLASGADAQKATATNASGPSSSAQAQSVSKSQDNQYGPGPILRPQTEGSWTQGGGRSMPRPPGPAPPLNAPSREFQGPERANLGGPTPPPMSLGQGGPAPPPLGAYHMPYRGMMPPPFMFPNGPPAPGPGFYPPGARFSMPIPPRAPPPSVSASDGPREHPRGRGPHHSQQSARDSRPSAGFTSKPIIKDEDLKRMDEIGGQDGGWASTQDDVDYNKTISFSDEDDGKDNKRSALKGGGMETRNEMKNDRDRDDIRGMERRPTKILERQPSANDRDPREMKEQQQRFDNIPNKDLGPSRSGGPYNIENEDEWKSQQQQGQVFPPQQQQRRVNLTFEDKNREAREHRDRDPRDRRNDDRGGRRQNDRRDEITDNWRSSNTNRPFDDDGRGNKGAQSRGRDEPRIEQRDFPSKSHPNNLPPRLQRQQFQTVPGVGGPQQPQQPSANQRQTPSPGSSGGKDRDRDFPSGRDWESGRDNKGQQDRRRMDNDPNRKRDPRDRRYFNDYEPRNERFPEKELKNSRYGSDFQRERSKESDDAKSGSSVSSGSAPSSRTETSRPPGDNSPDSKKQEETKTSAKPKMSWADEMDDDEIHRAREQDDTSRKGNSKHEPQSSKIMQAKPDYYPKPPEERQKRVYIHKNQRKVADMQSQKPDPPVEVKQSSEPSKLESEETEKVKPLSAWGERDSREKMGKNEKEQSPQRDSMKFSSGNGSDSKERKSQEKEISPKSYHNQSSVPLGNAQNTVSTQKAGIVNSNDSLNLIGGNQQDQGFNKSAMITKSASGRSVGGDIDSTGSGHRVDQRNSISDASDRDHLDRDSISSQENRSKGGSRQGTQDSKSFNAAAGGGTAGAGENGKSKQRPVERERREKTLSERDGGSDVGSEHGGSHRGEKSQRGQRNRDRGTYPVHRGSRDRPGWDRPRSRGSRGRGSSHYYDKPASKRSDSEREQHDRDDLSDKQFDNNSKSSETKDDSKEKLDSTSPRGNAANSKKDQQGADENQRPKKEKDLGSENSTKKSGKNVSSSKRGSNANNARGGGKLEGYGPPSDQKPFSNANKQDDDGDKKDKIDIGQGNLGKEGGIPSLMAVDISPPSISQLKKGHRDREFHSGGRSAVPPRLQNQRGAEPYPDNRFRGSSKRGKGDAPPSSNMSLSQKKIEGEDSEDWTDNDSDAESKKSGTASNKSRKDSSSKAPGAEKNRQSQNENLNSRENGNAPGRNANTMITLGSLPQMMSSSGSANTTDPTNLCSNQDSTNNNNNHNIHSANNIMSSSRSRAGHNKAGTGSGSATAAAVVVAGGDTDSYAKSLNASSSSTSSSCAEPRSHMMISDKNEHIGDSGGHQDMKRKNKPTKQEKGFSNKTTAASTTARNGNSDKGSKAIRVKNPPYEARSVAHSNNLPPRFANKRDSNSGPPGNVSSGVGKGLDSTSNPPKGIEPAAPPVVNAWEKPIAPAFRPDQNSQQNLPSSNATSHATHDNKDSSDVKLSSVSPISGGGGSSNTTSTVAAAVLDGTNPPVHTMIFENRKLKSGFAESNTNKSNAASKLPEVKKDSLPSATGIEFGKNLGSLGFGKGPGEDSPELDFGQSPFDDPPTVPQNQPTPSSMMTTHHHTSSPKPASLLQQSSRHTFDHQPSPISPCAAELTEKIQSVKRVWENPSMPSVPEQTNVCGPDENAFHGAFSSDSFKGSDSSSRDFGPSSLPPSAVGFSGGNSPSMAAMANPESRSSPNANNIRPPSKPQQQPPVSKSQGHGGMSSAFGSYGIEPQHMGANNYGVPVVAPPNKIMYASKVVPLDPFQSQFTQYQNAPSGGCAPTPYAQGGSVLIRPLDPKYQQLQFQQQQHGGQNRQTGQGSNHNSVSPGPITSSAGGNSGGGAHINSRSNAMMSKNQPPNRNTGHACMSQPVHQQGYYHAHNPMTQQQVPKGAFGPANGGYSDGGISPAYQPQILIPVDVNTAMFNIGGNYESSDLSRGPPPQGPAPPGTPPVQGSSSYYFGSNNNPACVFPPNSSQNFGLQFAASLKMPTFNSTGGSASDSGSNLGSQRIRPSEQSFIQPGLEPLPQNALKSQHDYLINQQRWNSANDFSVNQGIHWSAPGPIQRPIYNTPSAGPVGMQMVHSHSSSHYMPPNIGPPPGHVGVKPNNSSNDSMNNPGTPPKSPHPRKNI